ncbi:MAG: hypothetical protein FJ403_08255 [Verrucomicrobia bacterium]|nr:hypothetical protein [Verrucomicrobiota bacterium]
MKKAQFVTAAFLASTLSMVSAADIVGKITLKGKTPEETPLPLDAMCAATRQDKPTTRFYLVDASGGLADAFVYIKEGLAGKKFDPPKEPVVLDQVGCEYVPYVLGAQVGQQILVKNSDPVGHNVHPTPFVAGNKEQNKFQFAKAPPLTFVFDKPEMFLRFKCDIHGWMFAYVSVMEHPYFAVSGKDGTFKIANVPPGKYVIEVSHRKAKAPIMTKEITVDGKDQKADFTLEVPPPAK